MKVEEVLCKKTDSGMWRCFGTNWNRDQEDCAYFKQTTVARPSYFPQCEHMSPDDRRRGCLCEEAHAIAAMEEV